MKIAIIGQKGIPATIGGVEKHVEGLATGLVRVGHEVIVYTRPGYTDPKLKEHKGVRLITLKTIATKHLDTITHTFNAILDVSKRNVDLIHFHSVGPSILIPLAKLLNPGVPVVSTFHCNDQKHQKWGLFAKLCLIFGEFASSKFADKTITVSRSLRNYAIRKYKSKAIYVPNGVDTLENKEIENIKYFGLKNNEYILAVSRLIKHKGIQYLVKAYNELKTDKKLVIVGEGAYTDKFVAQLKALAQGNKNIIFTGRQSGRNLEELFSNAYLFVQPSESEGLSVALLEAMAYAKTTLVSDIPENLEAVGPTGFTFRNKNYIDLKNRLATLLRNPDVVEKMGILERDRVREEYNWGSIIDKTEKIYNNVLLSSKVEKKSFFKLKLAQKFMNLFF